MTALESPGRLLIIKPSSLGDVIHGLPFLNAVRREWPEAMVHWVIGKGLEELIASTPGIDRLISFPKDEWKQRGVRAIPDMCRFRKMLGAGHYDMTVDLQGLLRSGVVTMWSRADVRVGFADAREGAAFFYNRRVGCRDVVHAVDRNMAVAKALGCHSEEVEFGLGLRESDAADASEILSKCGIDKDFLVINPGARWKTKIWPAARFGRVASEIHEASGLRSVVTGGPGDIEIAHAVCAAADGAAVSLAGRTRLGVLTGILARARALLSNDSGPMHVAVALGRPVVAIFGPTDPARTGPYGKGHVVLRASVPCAPCRKRECSDMGCILGVESANVTAAVLGILEGA